jgi:hypothetical protein
MNANEPVGVVCEFEGILVGTLFEQLPDGTPLYTHPAKTLTDQEILKMAADKFHYSEYKLVIDFAKAILRKAQEK